MLENGACPFGKRIDKLKKRKRESEHMKSLNKPYERLVRALQVLIFAGFAAGLYTLLFEKIWKFNLFEPRFGSFFFACFFSSLLSLFLFLSVEHASVMEPFFSFFPNGDRKRSGTLTRTGTQTRYEQGTDMDVRDGHRDRDTDDNNGSFDTNRHSFCPFSVFVIVATYKIATFDFTQNVCYPKLLALEMFFLHIRFFIVNCSHLRYSLRVPVLFNHMIMLLQKM